MKESFKRRLFYKLANNRPVKFFLKIFPSRGMASRLEHRNIKGKRNE